MLAEFLLIAAGVFLGRYQWFLVFRSNKSSWRRTQQSIETRVMMEFERERQEHLLLSVMPAYIAVEVKKSISGRDSGQERMTQFKDLYVQRHSNVSILYADIVNFTSMAESLPAYHLVATLNQLFASFDQLALVFLEHKINQLINSKI